MEKSTAAESLNAETLEPIETINLRVPESSTSSRRLQVVAEWDRITFDLQGDSEREYLEKEVFEKVLMQGVKVDSEGNIYVSTARWGGRQIPSTVSQVVKGDEGPKLQPFPSKEFNEPGNAEALQSVLGFEIDRNDVMWILDQGHIGGRSSPPGAEKVVLWDLKAGRELQRYVFEKESDNESSFLNDIVVDNDTGYAYITDSGNSSEPVQGGLIVYDSNKDRARRVLDSTVFTNDQPGFRFRIKNRPVLKESPMRTGADGIALSGDKKTLYWTNLSGEKLYALPTATLRDFSTTEADIRSSVRIVGDLPSNTDGMACDREGNLYMTALQLNGILLRKKEGSKSSIFVSHPEMVWPDTLGWHDGWLYVTSNKLNFWNDGAVSFQNPEFPNFRIWRIYTGGRSYLHP